MSTDSTTNKNYAAVGDSPMFDGTDVSVQELQSYMRKDRNLYGFLHKFPSVSMEQALAELERDARAMAKRVIQCDSETADGALVFARTDVPVKRMFEYLADIKSLKDFHWDFPAVFNEDAYDALVTSGKILELDAYRGVFNGVVDSNRKYVSGTPRFVDSRLPIRSLFDVLAETGTLKDFSYSFPGPTKKQLAAILELSREALEREVCASAAG